MTGPAPRGDAEVVVRPMRPDDRVALAASSRATQVDLRQRLGLPIPRRLFEPPPPPEAAALGPSVVRLFLDTDPGGLWVACAGEELVGAALAARREGLWYLAQFNVTPGYQGRGIGRRLLERAMAYGADARGMLLHSSPDPQAMRAYQRAGFALLPALEATGVARRDRLPVVEHVRDGDEGDLDLATAVDRIQRGAGHGPDLGLLLRLGARLLVADDGADRGYAVVDDGGPKIVAATDERTAVALLWAALAENEDAAVTVSVLRADQQWAIDVCCRAGLDLAPTGPLCRRGDTGPMAPYLPHTGLL